MGRHTATVTTKGQVTLPSELRKELGIKAGDKIDFERNAQGNFEIVAKTLRMADLRGLIKTDIVLSDSELQAAISEGWGERWRRYEDDREEDGGA